MSSPSFVYDLAFVELLTPFLLDFASLYAFSRVLYSQLKRATEGSAHHSPTLMLYVLAWTSTMVALYPYLGYMLLSLASTGGVQSTYWMLWTGLLFIPVSMSVPIAVFFLSLNRLLALKFPLDYTPQHQEWLLRAERVCLALGIASMLAVFGGYTAAVYLASDSTQPAVTPCLAFHCLVKPVWDVYAGAKAGIGFMNLCVGLLLLAEVWEWGRGRQRGSGGNGCGSGSATSAANRANAIAAVAVGTELFFNFLPQMVVVVLTWAMPSVAVTDYLGPYNIFIGSFDSLISSLVYMQLLVRGHSQERLQQRSSHVQVVNHRRSTVAAIATLQEVGAKRKTSYENGWVESVK